MDKKQIKGLILTLLGVFTLIFLFLRFGFNGYYSPLPFFLILMIIIFISSGIKNLLYKIDRVLIKGKKNPNSNRGLGSIIFGILFIITSLCFGLLAFSASFGGGNMTYVNLFMVFISLGVVFLIIGIVKKS